MGIWLRDAQAQKLSARKRVPNRGSWGRGLKAVWKRGGTPTSVAPLPVQFRSLIIYHSAIGEGTIFIPVIIFSTFFSLFCLIDILIAIVSPFRWELSPRFGRSTSRLYETEKTARTESFPQLVVRYPGARERQSSGLQKVSIGSEWK